MAEADPEANPNPNPNAGPNSRLKELLDGDFTDEDMGIDTMDDVESKTDTPTQPQITDLTTLALEAKEPDLIAMLLEDLPQPGDIAARARYIPLRLSYEERKFLRLVEAAVNVSDYTNSVDKEFRTLNGRRHAQLQNICSFLSGIVSAESYSSGQVCVAERSFTGHEEYLQTVLEIARRYKIMNPEKMRSEYGKLVYLMQDALGPEILSLLGVNIRRPIKTVYELLESKGALAVLTDKHIEIATQEILPDQNKSRSVIQREIKAKEKAIEAIVQKYETRDLTEEDIRLCLYSICDNNSFLNSNRLPLDKMIDMLKKNYKLEKYEEGYSLAIEQGAQGARLSHTHTNQYRYVLQSLTLWREIVNDMFRLWYLSEEDLLSDTNQYTLALTGQGLQRVQESPRVYRAMHEILYHTQRALGNWVGSSVIHLGDRNVPNALMFIDKYTQVSRILGPVVHTLEQLQRISEEDRGVNVYLSAYGGVQRACKDILLDFFTHAFDGSGADNFYDAGSCIDGRLTSAWNWCSQLSDKPYYPLFRLTGFTSFDGEWAK